MHGTINIKYISTAIVSKLMLEAECVSEMYVYSGFMQSLA